MSFASPSSSPSPSPKEVAAERRRIRVQKLKLLRLKNSTTVKLEDDRDDATDCKSRNAFSSEAPLGGRTDERQRKKHNRMIRNRESAALSRQKKRDRITELEDKVKLLVDENRSLRRRLEKCEQVQRFGNFSNGVSDGGSNTPPLAVHVTYINGYHRIDPNKSYLNQHSAGLHPGQILREPVVKIWPGDEVMDSDASGSAESAVSVSGCGSRTDDVMTSAPQGRAMDDEGGEEQEHDSTSYRSPSDPGGAVASAFYKELHGNNYQNDNGDGESESEHDRDDEGMPAGAAAAVTDAEMYACLMDVLDDEP